MAQTKQHYTGREPMTRAAKISDRASQFFIDGAWVDAKSQRTLVVVYPATEAVTC